MQAPIGAQPRASPYVCSAWAGVSWCLGAFRCGTCVPSCRSWERSRSARGCVSALDGSGAAPWAREAVGMLVPGGGARRGDACWWGCAGSYSGQAGRMGVWWHQVHVVFMGRFWRLATAAGCGSRGRCTCTRVWWQCVQRILLGTRADWLQGVWRCTGGRGARVRRSHFACILWAF